jgi:hypothetical protein
VVERDLAKVDVAGSTPVSRSNFSFLIWIKDLASRKDEGFCILPMAHQPVGGVDFFGW